jgi:hypothetical protein
MPGNALEKSRRRPEQRREDQLERARYQPLQAGATPGGGGFGFLAVVAIVVVAFVLVLALFAKFADVPVLAL